MNYRELSKTQLIELKSELENQYRTIQEAGLKLDMSRGKPCREQLDLSIEMVRNLHTAEDLISEEGFDCRNYGVLDGLLEARKLVAELTEAQPENVIIAGNGSLNLMYSMVSHGMLYGVGGEKPWHQQGCVRFLCPVPGYDRHFKITEALGIQMIPVPMSPEGPDMNLVEQYVNHDSSVKGIWCVPKYSNPDGYTYSDETVRRMAALTPAAPDFRIYWDNAYLIHHFDFSNPDTLLNLRKECEKNGRADMVYEFISTSKMVFPGSGMAAFISSPANIAEMKRHMSIETIGYDKVNQLRHVRFFHDLQGITEHMKKHAAIIRPRVQMVLDHFQELGECGIARWTEPHGGYFLSLYTLPGCAKRIVSLCKNAGVVLTGAGAAYPLGKDPDDAHIRIAPTYPPMAELDQACHVVVLCVKLASVEKLLETC